MYTGPGAIRGVFVNDALAKGAVFTIASGTNDPQQTPQVASDGTNWLVTWRDAAGHTLRGARVDTNGNVLDASPLAIAQNQTLGKVTSSFDGTDYLIAWESGGLRLARITTAGTVLDPGGVPGQQECGPALAGRLLAYSRPASGRSRVVVRLRAPAPVVEDGGVDGAPADGGVPPSDGAVPPADGGVDSSPAEAGVDGGSDGGSVSDAGSRPPTAGRDSPRRRRRPTPRLPTLEAMQSRVGTTTGGPLSGTAAASSMRTSPSPHGSDCCSLWSPRGAGGPGGAPRREGRVSERRAA